MKLEVGKTYKLLGGGTSCIKEYDFIKDLFVGHTSLLNGDKHTLAWNSNGIRGFKFKDSFEIVSEFFEVNKYHINMRP